MDRQMSPFARRCSWEGCNEKITRATGEIDADYLSVRCAAGHRSEARRNDRGQVALSPDPDGVSLAAVTEPPQG